jgi:hypothetical protein
MKKMMSMVFLTAAVVFLSGVCIAGDAKEEKALKAADAWLKLVDDGKYKKSWENAAQYFKNSLTSAQWEQAVSPVRKPLGKVLKRTVKSKEYRTTLPGAPDGEYVVIQYATSFENKNSAVETVTPMLDKDGTWRVSGYYIK